MKTYKYEKNTKFSEEDFTYSSENLPTVDILVFPLGVEIYNVRYSLRLPLAFS